MTGIFVLLGILGYFEGALGEKVVNLESRSGGRHCV